jgi:hypothetical protein
MSKTLDVRRVAARAYWGEEDARVVVAAWQASGEGLSAFARRHGLDRGRVGRWVRRLQAPASVRFHPVRLTGDSPPSPSAEAIEIELRAGLRIRLPRGFDAEDLRRLLAVVVEGGLPC